MSQPAKHGNAQTRTNEALTQGVRLEASPCTRQTCDGVEVIFAAVQKTMSANVRAKSSFENNLGP